MFVSADLQDRLERIAANRQMSVEDLLCDFADQAEQAPFPGDPYKFFDVSAALICVADLQGNFLYVNPTFCHTLGYTQEELMAQPYTTFVHPDDLPATRELEAALNHSPIVTQFEDRYRHRDGHYLWFSWASITEHGLTYAVALNTTEQKHTEQQLLELSERNQRILRSIFDGFLLGDKDGNILDVNQTYCDMLGYTHEELLQKSVFDLDAQMTEQEIAENAREILDEDVSLVFETQQRRKDGQPLDVEINSIQLENGKIAAFIRDISDRKRLERQLRHSEQLYRGLIESQIDFVCRYTPDTVLTYVNDAYCSFFGRSREELMGQTFLQFAPEPEHEMIFSRIEQVKQNPAPDVRILYAYDDAGKKKWLQWIDYGITDESGEVVAIQAVGRDITALMETQNRLREREEMLSTIFKNIPIMLVQVDAEGRYEYVNDYCVEVLGWTLEEMRAHPDILSEFYPDPRVRLDVLNEIYKGAAQWNDYQTHTRHGDIIDTSWANVRLSNGRILGIGQVMTHRVELENQRIYARQLELELEKERELREMKDRFASLVSHELRTPLSVMSTSVDFVKRYRDRLAPERVDEKLTLVQQQIRRMVMLMEDTLRFSTGEAKKTPFHPEPIPIREFCQEVIETIRLTDADGHNIHLHCNGEAVHADPKLLDHILTNLLSNAVKYSPAASDVTLSLAEQAGEWMFSIQDEGIGIPEQDLEKLFLPFHRAENVHKLPGTGLGLSIVKDYVELHGGAISIESTLNTGTTFTFTIPKSTS